MATSTLTSKGQVTLPKEIRDRLGLRPGHQLSFELGEDGRIVVRAKTVPLSSLAGMLRRRGQEAFAARDRRRHRARRGRELSEVGRVIALDTNVLVRYLVADDAAQFAVSQRSLARLGPGADSGFAPS